MPPRWLALAIVTFWLGTTGWLFWRDLWPQWRPGGPPPYTIDLVEEVHRQKKVKTLWAVLEDDRETLQAQSWVEHRPADDTFSLHVDYTAKTNFGRPGAGLVPRHRPVSSLLRVTRDGNLRELEVRASLSGGRLPLNSTILLAGEVRGDHFLPRYRVEQAGVVLLEGKLTPVDVSYHGSVLVPQHPVNRIQGLRPGQTWRMPVVDPFAAGFGFADAVRYVNARVLPGTHELRWRERKRTCLVIEYEGGEERASTWVEVGSDLVQRQEASFGGSRFVLQRDD
jgi:hypothetical protein